MPELTFRVKGDVSDLKRSLADARREVSRGIGSLSVPGLGSIGGLLTGTGLVAAVGALVGKFTDAAKAARELSVEAQASIGDVSVLMETAKRFGVSTDEIAIALNNLAQATSDRDLFKQLGVGLEDATGAAKPLLTLFNEVLKVIQDSAGDYNTLRVAQELFKRGAITLNPILRANNAEWEAQRQAVIAAGGALDEEGVAKARQYELVMLQLGDVLQQFGGIAIPFVVDALRGLGQAFDVIGTFVREFWANLTGPGQLRNPLDVLGESMDAAQQRADAARASLQKLGATPGGGGGRDLSDVVNRAAANRAAAEKAITDALKARMDAIKEDADERERTMRKALDSFEKERRAAITTIQDEQDARQRQHELELRAIDDESRARQDAFDATDRGRQDELDALREQIRGTQELADLERSRADVADAEAAAASERNVEIFRSAGQSQNEYGRAVRDQQRRIADADKRVAATKKKLEEDTARSGIDARIRAIETEQQASARALGDYKKGAEERQRAIQDQISKEREQSDARVKQIQAELDAEQKRATDEIDQLQEVTRVTLKELDAQVKAGQAAASAVSAAWDAATRPRTITITTTDVGDTTPRESGAGSGAVVEPAGGAATRQDVIDAYRTYLGRDPEDEGAIAGRVGMAKGALINEIRNSPEGQAYEMGSYGRGLIAQRSGERRPESIGVILDPASRASLAVHDYPHTMTFNEPATIIGRSGTNYGTIAARGDEDVYFGGVGGSRRGRGGDSVNVNAYGIGVAEAARLIARENAWMLARRAGRGYGRRR